MSFFDSADDALDAQKAANAEASDATKYSPEAGDTVNAVLLQARLFTGGQYDPAITITFRNVGEAAVGGIEAGKSGRLFLSTVLARQMTEAAPAIGSPFMLRYEGKVKPESGGNAFHDWTVVTPFTKDGDEASRDIGLWTSIQPPEVGGSGRAASTSGDSDWKF